jgi:hypothetical protein
MIVMTLSPRWQKLVALCHKTSNADRMTTDDLEPGLSIAVRELLQGIDQVEDPVENLCLAARESMKVRERNSHNGGLVLTALRRRHRLTWREIERRTGINTRTARRWSVPPDVAETNEGGAQ